MVSVKGPISWSCPWESSIKILFINQQIAKPLIESWVADEHREKFEEAMEIITGLRIWENTNDGIAYNLNNSFRTHLQEALFGGGETWRPAVETLGWAQFRSWNVFDCYEIGKIRMRRQWSSSTRTRRKDGTRKDWEEFYCKYRFDWCFSFVNLHEDIELLDTGTRKIVRRSYLFIEIRWALWCKWREAISILASWSIESRF